MTLKLKKSGYELELIEEMTGDLIIKFEKDARRALDLETVTEQSKLKVGGNAKTGTTQRQILKYGESVKVPMEYLPDFVISAKKGEESVVVDSSFVSKLGATDYYQLKQKIDQIMETGGEGFIQGS